MFVFWKQMFGNVWLLLLLGAWLVGSPKPVYAQADLVMKSWSTSLNTAQGAGTSMTITYNVANVGNGSASTFEVAFYYGDTSSFRSLTRMGTAQLPSLPGGTSTGNQTLTVQLPTSVAWGVRYIHFYIDPSRKIPERSDTNNYSGSSSYPARRITITGLPDLRVEVVSVSPGAQIAGGVLTVTFRIYNAGFSRVTTYFDTRFYYSDDSKLGGDTYLTYLRLNSLPARTYYPSSESAKRTVTVPSSAKLGLGYILVHTDYSNRIVNEVLETNNVKAASFAVVSLKPELSMSLFSASSRVGGYNSSLPVTFSVRNSGGANSGPFQVSFYYSASSSATNLILLGQSTVSRVDPGKDTGRLSVSLKMPKEATVGTRYLHYFVDSGQQVSEVNETNNRSYRSIRFTGYPNLQVSRLVPVPGSQMPNGEVDMLYTVFNSGATGTTRAYRTSVLRFYYSTDTSLSTRLDVNLGSVNVPTMNANSSYSGTFRVKLPANAAVGSRYVFAWADATNVLTEQSNSDNVRRASVTVTRAIADLVVSNWSVPSSTTGAGSSVPISFTVENKGNSDASESTLAFYYSDTELFANTTQIGTVKLPKLRAGQTFKGTFNATMPNNVLQGTRAIHYWVDGSNKVAELNETNNRGKKSLIVSGLPNLQVDALSLQPTQQVPGGEVRLSFRVANRGASRITANTTARIYFSTNSTLESSDTLLASVTVPPLLAGSLYPGTSSAVVTVKIPTTALQGTGYLGVFANEPDTLRESSDSDNTKSVAVKLAASGADLEMGSWKLDSSSFVGAGDSVRATLQVRNKGRADAGPFVVGLYYGDSTSTKDLKLLGQVTVPGLKAGALDSSRTVTVKLPNSVQSGKRYIHYFIDPTEQVDEVSESNNRGSTGINLSGKPNLRVDVFSFTPTKQAAGGKVNVTYRISNVGRTRLATPTAISFYDSTDRTIEKTDNLLETIPLNNLDVSGQFPASASGSVFVTVPAQATSGQNRFVGVFVDPENRVAEANESDNTRSASLLIVGSIAELKLASAVVNPTAVGGAKNNVTVEFRVQNSGSLDAVGFNVTFYYGDSKEPVRLRQLGSTSVRRVDANTTDSKRTIRLVLPNSVNNGTRYIHYWVDSGQVISELDEQNNRSSIPLKVSGLPNLQVSKLGINTNVQDQGRDVVLTYRLYNAGLTQAANFKLAVVLKRNAYSKTLQSLTIQSLDAFAFSPASADGTLTVRIPNGIVAGQYTLSLVADVDNVVTELLESDNQRSVVLTVRPGKPDLVAKQASVTPTSQRVGQSVTLSYEIQNLLDVAVPLVRVGVYFSKDARFDPTDPQAHTFVVSNLKGKQTVKNKVTFSLPMSFPGGKGRLILVVDDAKQISEFDESNNEASTPFEVFVDQDKDNVYSDKDCNDNDKTVYPGAPEICDNKDNNCNNKVDDDPRCVCKSSDPPRPCFSGGSECSLQSNGTFQCKGLCKAGTQTCSSGVWGKCVGEVKSSPEVCDGKDNDCNGKVDDTLVRQCFSGSSGCTRFQDGFFRCKAPCRAGLQSCAGGKWGACTGETLPAKEKCDGFDNDCDGQIDNQPVSSNPLEQPCQNSCGGSGVEVCQSGQWGACSAPSCEPKSEPAQEPFAEAPGDGAADGGGTDTSSPDGDCYQAGCPSGEICQQGQCVKDPCEGTSCASDELCRDGQCVKSCGCLRCKVGTKCIDGACEVDPCSNVNCPSGEVCNPKTSKCWSDPCDSVTCGTGRVCKEGSCVDDPCNSVRCPSSQQCVGGQCVRTNCSPSENQDEVTREANPDASVGDSTPDEQAGDKGGGVNKPDTSQGPELGEQADLLAPKGCSCSLDSDSTSLAWLLLLGWMLFLSRRRSRRAR